MMLIRDGDLYPLRTNHCDLGLSKDGFIFILWVRIVHNNLESPIRLEKYILQ